MKRFVPALLLLLSLTTFARPGTEPSYDERDDVQAFVADLANRQGFDAATLLAHFHHVRHIPAVIKAIRPPADPGIRSWQAYRSRFVEPRRIDAGRRFMTSHRAALERAEQRYGVPASVIASIIGVETIYGRNTGRFETLSALSTLAFDYPPRADLFRRELEALLLLAREEHRAPESYRGSYAGALGLPQFLPSSVRNWADDFDGNGNIDLMNPVDAIGSVARFLSEHGWERDGPIWQPATVSGENVASLLAEGLEPRRTPRELAENGVVSGNAPDHPAALIDLVTPGAPTEYRLGYRNFYVLTRYNRSSFYASAVADLAEELAPR